MEQGRLEGTGQRPIHDGETARMVSPSPSTTNASTRGKGGTKRAVAAATGCLRRREDGRRSSSPSHTSDTAPFTSRAEDPPLHCSVCRPRCAKTGGRPGRATSANALARRARGAAMNDPRQTPISARLCAAAGRRWAVPMLLCASEVMARFGPLAWPDDRRRVRARHGRLAAGPGQTTSLLTKINF